MSTETRQRILITGSSGFIGTNLVEALIARGNPVLGLDSLPPKNKSHTGIWKQQDLLDGAGLSAKLRDFSPDVVVHLGARTDLDGSSVADYAANHEGTRHLMEAADGCPSVQRVIFASTRLVNVIGYQPKSDEDYGPTTYYGESKVLGEQLVRGARPNYTWTIVRPTSIWGPWFGVPYRIFFDSVLAGRYVHPRGQRIYKSFGYVGNVVFELLSIIEAEAASVHGSTFYLADYAPIEVYSFAREIAEQAGRQGSIIEVPMPVLKTMAVAGDLLKMMGWTNPPLTSFRLSNLVTQMLYDTSNLEKITGPLPFETRPAVAQTLQWLKNVEGK